jgi:hypothetical protein
VKYLFDAYLVDFVWEKDQGKNVQLSPVKMLETEKHGYNTRPVYIKNGDQPDSLTAWCYLHGTPVWICDDERLSRKNEYANLFTDNQSEQIPANTIYEYNKRDIKTEICIPLHNTQDKNWKRAAGVLNIECTHKLMPSGRAREVLWDTGNMLEFLHNRQMTLEPANDWAKDEYDRIRQLSDESHLTLHPRLKPSAFIAYPWGEQGAQEIVKWVTEYLKKCGVSVLAEAASTEQKRLTVLKQLRASNFGVVVTTGFNKNVLFEFGFLIGARKPIIRLHQDQGARETDHFNLEDFHQFSYAKTGENATRDGVHSALKEGMKALMDSNEEMRDLLYAGFESMSRSSSGEGGP